MYSPSVSSGKKSIRAPPNLISPDVGSRPPVKSRANVVFPEPDAPITPKACPPFRANVMFSKSGSDFSSTDKLTLSTSKCGSGLGSGILVEVVLSPVRSVLRLRLACRA